MTRKKTNSNQLTEKQALVLLKNKLEDYKGIEIDWDSFRRVSKGKYIFQLPVSMLSMNFLDDIKNVPLVNDVYFFAKIGTGAHGINLLFKLHIEFKEL